MKSNKFKFAAQALLAATFLAGMNQVYSDEGMWLYDDPPMEVFKAKYNFAPTSDWLEHLRKSSVRFNVGSNNGGSGSFISEDGLVISNHHVASDSIQKLSSQEENLTENGFYAKTLDEERKCLDLELNVLMSIEDVTARVNGAITADMTPEDANKARKAAIAKIEQESLDATGLRSDVVTLFQGGKYSLYRYKRYTDVRLVFAPEGQIGFFGGDPDNFEFPRYNLDISLFRVYEDGKPAKIENYLKWSKKGVAENDLTFVSGHPGSTERLITVAELKSQRDNLLPYVLERLNRLEVLYTVWAARNKENDRRAHGAIFGVQNSRKALGGRFAGVLEPSLMNKKITEEQDLKQAMAKSEEFKNSLSAFDQIETCIKDVGAKRIPYLLLERGQAFNSSYFGKARVLLRHAVEKSKDSKDRLAEYLESNEVSLKLSLFSTAPIYDDFEILKLTDSLKFLIEKAGYEDPLVQKILAGKTPEARAVELINGTCLKDPEKRKKIYDMPADQIQALNDPMIELARIVDDEARTLRKFFEEQNEITTQAHDKIAKARFALNQKHTYPDATFTLRLSFGEVKGYEEAGQKIPFQTNIKGLYQHARDHEFLPPFNMPEKWLKAEKKLDETVPCNFVSTADIIGGNSGSPVVNRDGEFVGIIFDGNTQSLVLDYAYSDTQARATSVNSQYIIEALKEVYKAKPLVKEILKGKR